MKDLFSEFVYFAQAEGVRRATWRLFAGPIMVSCLWPAKLAGLAYPAHNRTMKLGFRGSCDLRCCLIRINATRALIGPEARASAVTFEEKPYSTRRTYRRIASLPLDSLFFVLAPNLIYRSVSLIAPAGFCLTALGHVPLFSHTHCSCLVVHCTY